MRTASWSSAFILLNLAVLTFAQSSPQPSASPVLPAVYQHWLDEDVRWIIGPDEQKAFASLTDNNERDRFITQFWLRRDPTPGTSENELKEEHYRRIAYSNQHFAAHIQGALTDRGRIYIVYGPPDAIERRVISVAPEEIWHYQRPGSPSSLDFEFVDTCQCGDYRLMTPLPN